MNDLRAVPANALEDIESADGVTLHQLLGRLVAGWKWLLGVGAVAALVATGIALLVPPVFTARTSLLPPQQQQSAAAAAISQLGALANIAGGAAGIKSPGDQYVALMQSVTVSDRIVDQFELMRVYKALYRQDARRILAGNVRIGVGKKDGLLTVEVDDHDPARAAAMANAFVEGLRHLTGILAVSEAQQRRVFFETQLQQTKERLTKAQIALQGSGINQGTLKAEPKAVAEGYAKLRGETMAAEVRLQSLRRMMTESSPELQQQQATVDALRGQLARVERREDVGGDSDYVTKFREFKYQETLFDLFARQYEMARIDESREGALVQVVDVAQPPERPSFPRPKHIALLTFVGAMFATAMVLMSRRSR